MKLESETHLRITTEKLATGISIGTAVTSLVLLFAGVLRIGISVDEPLHLDMLVRFGARFELSEDYTFGPIPWIAGHLLNVVLGFESFGNPNESAEAYLGRHFSVAVFGVIGALGVANIVWLKTKGILWPLTAFALIVSFPLWLGHSMFNPKDIPNAAGFVVFVLGVLLISERSSYRGQYFVGTALIWAGFLISFGTRLSMVAPLTLVWMVAIIATVSRAKGLQQAREALRPHAWAALGLAGLVGVIFLLLLALNPPFYLRGLAIIIGSFQTATEFPWEGTVMVAGSEVTVPPPWWYVPAFTLAQSPLAVLFPFAVLVTTAVTGSISRFRLPGRKGRETGQRRVFPELDVLTAVMTTQLVATPLFIGLTGANIYDGLRHLLFAFPALVVFAVLASRRVWSATSERVSVLFMAVLSALMVSLTVQNLTLFPYNYSYYNEISALGGQIDENWETDYWHLSYRELAEELPESGKIICGFWPDAPITRDDLPYPCRELKPFVNLADDAEQLSSAHWLIMSQRYTVSDRANLPDHCEAVRVVKRRLHFQDVVMATLFRCDFAWG